MGVNLTFKDVTKKEYQQSHIYSVKYLLETCGKSYIGEIGRKLAERVSEHSGRDKSSYMYKKSIEKDHPAVKLQDFEIFSKGFRQKKFERMIKENKPFLTEKSVLLTLFN